MNTARAIDYLERDRLRNVIPLMLLADYGDRIGVAMAEEHGRSGVLLRMTGADKVWPKSIEAQLMHGNAGDFWNIDGVDMDTDAARRSGRRTSRAQLSAERPLGEWNQYRITVDHERVLLEVNGVRQNTARWCEEVAGKICLQSEGAPIEFRNIRLWPIVD